MGHFRSLLVALLTASSFVEAYPSPVLPELPDLVNTTSVLDEPSALLKRALPDLRVLCVGASIVWGLQSTDNNGFRKGLRDELRYQGYQVDMVGTKHNGNMKDNDVEAHPGDHISTIYTASQLSYKYLPNVVVINAGTNDIITSDNVATAGDRMRTLVEGFWNNGMPSTTIILTTLIPNGDATAETNRAIVNPQYRQLVTTLRSQGRPIVLADMDPPSGPRHGFLSYPSDYFSGDTTHPNDGGYKKMAAVIYQGFKDATAAGLITSPLPQTADVNCHKTPDMGNSAGGLTQRGSGQDDGIYYHDSQDMGTLLSVTSDYDRNQWFFARLFSRDRDDFIGWFTQSDGSVRYGVWRNDGATFTKINDLNPASNCALGSIYWIDVNADGLDDMVCVAADGSATASINQGNGSGSNPPSFTAIGTWKTSEGYPRERVRIGDIDGDGRADYCGLETNGDIRCWRNGWVQDVPAYWQAMGLRFTGKNMGDLSGVRFEDINGDGRDDWIWVDTNGATTTWTNARSCLRGSIGDGLNVAWRQGFHKDATSGPTHLGGFGNGENVRTRILFGRVYGTPQDFGLLGRQDYVYLEHVASGSQHIFNMRVFKSAGSGGTKLKADGNKYGNLLGHKDGRMDYIWALSKGSMTLFPNRGVTVVSDSGAGFWDAEQDNIFLPQNIIGKDLDRRDLILADWDGDGYDDIIWVNPDNQNRVSLFRNRMGETGAFNWDYQANPAPDLYCPEKRGVGIFDLPVQFADITGNGKADYLCIEKDGRTWGWVHNDSGGWDYIDQFKKTESNDRANIRYADVNGDGWADYIWTDKFTGDADVRYNQGRADVAGSRYSWSGAEAAYTGTVAGTCAYYPDLDGGGRADQHQVLATFDNTAHTWFNVCNGDPQGDDADGVHDPGLPTVPPVS
ncbi:hypothetical protein GQ53DRAFT_732005 [Thozetella sp. PMI_491]|nr:hypothetical protein GQ53DRAFT_732005 [Thozetella sp. PMI_491]